MVGGLRPPAAFSALTPARKSTKQTILRFQIDTVESENVCENPKKKNKLVSRENNRVHEYGNVCNIHCARAYVQ